MDWSQKTLNNNSNFTCKEELFPREENDMQKEKKQEKRRVAAVVAAIPEYGFSATNKATVKIVPLVQCKTN